MTQTGSPFSLEGFIDHSLVRMNLQAQDRGGVIRELTAALVDHGSVTDADAFVADVEAREAQGATGLGQGVSIPHGKSPAVARTSIAIGRTPAPVDWPSLDGQPVSTIFLFAVQESDADVTHLKLLQKIAILLADDSFVQALREVSTSEELITLITTTSKEKSQ